MELAIALTLIVTATPHEPRNRNFLTAHQSRGCEIKCIFHAMLYHNTIEPDLEYDGAPITAVLPFAEKLYPVAG